MLHTYICTRLRARKSSGKIVRKHTVRFVSTALLVLTLMTPTNQADAATSKYIFNANDTFVVPTGVTSITVKTWGGGGGGAGTGTTGASRTGGAGGGGGYIEATITVTPGETLDIFVGGGGGAGLGGGSSASLGGAGGTNGGAAGGSYYGGGGGGGGYSGVKRSGTSLIIAAGGGGGGGSDTTSVTGGAGGAGGGRTGTNGNTGGGGGGDRGDGATLSAGGTGGATGSGQNGTTGGSLAGGAGGGSSSGYGGGGGGGAGYYGGGGAEEGWTNASGGGGGGGSSYVTSGATATTTTAGSGTSAGNNADADYGNSAGAGGAGGAGDGVTGSAGTAGRVVVSYTPIGNSKQVFGGAGSESFVVPAGVTSITVSAWGAGGAGGSGGSNGAGSGIAGGAGGAGAFAKGTLSVTPGETLSVYVGAKGTAGGAPASGSAGDGGGGGGHSEVNRSGTNLIIAAGGGGGGGGDDNTSSAGGAGGAGGLTTGVNGGGASNGAAAGAGGSGGSGVYNSGTAGGSEAAGDGADGSNSATDGSENNGGAADDGDGGTGGASNPAGGGGGGGYYGGGGGGAEGSGVGGDGGGGGRSYFVSTATATTSSAAGSGATPGGTGDAEYSASNAGGGGAGASQAAGSSGEDGRIVITYTESAITISGTLYQADGTTVVTTGETIKMVVATSTPGVYSATTDGTTGAFSFAMATSTLFGSTTPVTLYVDGDASIKATTLLHTNFTPNAGGEASLVNLVSGAVRIHHANSSSGILAPTTSFKDSTYDSDIHYTFSGSTMTVGSSATSTDLVVSSGTFDMPTTVNLYGDLEQNAKLDSSGNTLYMAGTTQYMSGTLIGTNTLGALQLTNTGTTTLRSAASSTSMTVSSGKKFLTLHNLSTSGGFTNAGMTVSSSTIASKSLSGNLGGISSQTIRQLISSSVLQTTGTGPVRVTFGAGSGGASLSSAYIGMAAASGDAYDFASTPVQIKFSGATSKSFSTDQSITSDPVILNVESGKNLLISFYLTSGNVNFENYADVNRDIYVKAANETATVNVTGYSNYDGSTWFVERVDMAATTSTSIGGDLSNTGTYANQGTITTAGNFTNNGTIHNSNSGTISVAGNVINNTVFSNTGTLALTGSSKTLSTVSSNPHIGTIIVTGNVDFTSNASTTDITVSATGDFTPGTLLTIDDDFTLTAGGALNFSGKTTYFTGASGSLNGAFTGSNALGNVIVMSGASFDAGFPDSLETADLTIRSGGSMSKYTLTVAGNLLIQGTMDNSGNVTLSGINKTVTTSDKTFSSSITITGSTTLMSAASTTDLVINNGGVLVTGNTLGIEDDFTNNGTFTATSGTAYFYNSTDPQNISGSGTTVFNNINFISTRPTSYSTNYYTNTMTSGTSWTVPSNADSTVKIEAAGMSGGSGDDGSLGGPGGSGGDGGYVSGMFSIAPNTVIGTYFDYPGGAGGVSYNPGNGGMGGYSRRVQLSGSPYTLYVVAGGGGGGAGGYGSGGGGSGGAGGGATGGNGSVGIASYYCGVGGGGTSSAGGMAGGGGDIPATDGDSGASGGAHTTGGGSGGGGGGSGYRNGGGGGGENGGFTACGGGGGSSYVNPSGSSIVNTAGGGGFGSGYIKFTYSVTTGTPIDPNPKTISAPITVNNMTIGQYSILQPSADITIKGNYSNSGTFTAGTSEVILAGTAQQTVSGTLDGTSDFYDLTITNTSQSGSSTQSVVFSSEVDATGTFTMQPNTSAQFVTGSSNPNIFQNVSIEGTIDEEAFLRSATPGTYWYIDVPGTKDIQYVDVKDSNAAQSITAINSIDAGHNSNWVFSSQGTTTLASHNGGQIGNAFSNSSATAGTLFAFKLTPEVGTTTVTNMVFNISGVKKLTNDSFSNVKLYLDTNSNQVYDGGDTQVGGAGSVSISGAAGTITFTGDFSFRGAKNIILVADWSGLLPGSFMTISLASSDVTVSVNGGIHVWQGSITAFQHYINNKGGGRGTLVLIDLPAPDGNATTTGGGQGGNGQGGGLSDSGQTIDSDPNFRRPSAQSGSWTTGANAYDGVNGTYASTNAANTHSFTSHSFTVPGGNSIVGIEVKLELSGTTAAGTVGAELSWNGGNNWTSLKASPTLTTSDAVISLGSPADTWGRSWTIGEFSNANFVVRLTGAPSANTVKVDEMQVRVYYQTSGGGGGGGADI